MNILSKFKQIKNAIDIKRALKLKNIFLKKRCKLYKSLSNCKNIQGSPKINQPTLFIGQGRVEFGENVTLGYFPSPFFFEGYIHFDARDHESAIIIGDNTIINNSCVFGAFKANINIGRQCLLGTNIEIINADYHDTNPDKRFSDSCYLGESKDVNIGDNVWLGNSVKVLKGVSIGDNCVIGAGSVVTRDIPKDTIAAGNPAKVLKAVPKD